MPHSTRQEIWRNELLPNAVDDLARITPNSLYAEYPRSTVSYEHGYRKVTYKDLANAINGAAWWLFETLGPSTTHEVLAYIGPNDVRYTVFLLAAVKTGHVIFLTSPRNSVAAHVKLFERLQCSKILSSDPVPAAVSTILETYVMQHMTVPSVEDLLDTEFSHYGFEKTFKGARLEPLAIVHTSGSTGFPKPLIWSHETAARMMNMWAEGTSPVKGARLLDSFVKGQRLLNCFPPFHGACLFISLFSTIPFGAVMIAPLSGTIPTAAGVVAALHQTPADEAFLVPSIVHELSQDDALLDYCCRNLERCVFAGGDLPQAVGDKVASKLHLVCQWGASEVGMPPQLLPNSMDPKTDWKFVQFHPCLGTDFRKAADGTYELVVKRDHNKDNVQATFTMFPDMEVYETRDLFEPHPSIPNSWSWQARADDIIVFLNGEKTNPISMEQHVQARNPEVSAALVVGAQRFQAALMVEATSEAMPQTTANEAAFIERIWPSIEEANKVAPAHARIEKAMVLPMTANKPAVRAGKGTIQRAGTLQLYAAELDRLYENADMGLTGQDNIETSEVCQDIDSISHLVRTVLEQVSGKTGVDDDSDFFALGVDSLHALSMTRKLRNSLHMPEIAVATIYSNPSIAQLSKAIESLQLGKQESIELNEQATEQSITLMLEEYQRQVLKLPPSTSRERQSAEATVVLTGSTGALGTYLLDALLEDPMVTHVYCLNRRPNSQDIQKHCNDAASLPTRADESRVTFLTADLAQPNFGLSAESYESIRRSATRIIHNAWPVNFNLSLPTFQPQMTGLLNLFSLSASATLNPTLFFVSSISSVLGLRTPSRLTPEAIVTDTAAPLASGYAQSKLISELLCDTASKHLHIPVSIARVGQIAGPVRRPGIWNPTEYIPSLVKSAVYLGALPDVLGSGLDRVDWMPVDLLAETIVDLAISRRMSDTAETGKAAPAPSGAEVLHLQNPNSTTWSALSPSLQSSIEALTGKHIAIVPAKEWIAMVRQSLGSVSEEVELDEVLRLNPAAKLLDFFTASMLDTEERNVLDLQETLEKSASLRAMEGVNDEWVRKWVAEWLST